MMKSLKEENMLCDDAITVIWRWRMVRDHSDNDK